MKTMRKLAAPSARGPIVPAARRPATGMTRCVGIDPGGMTGLVCVDVPRDGILRARWVGHARVRALLRPEYTEPEKDASLAVRIADVLGAWQPTLVVLEEPADAVPSWGAGSRTKGAGRGTIFGLGRAYGCALAACAFALDDATLASYPVTSAWKKDVQTRVGWMQHFARKVTPRVDTLSRMRALAERLYVRPYDGRLVSADVARQDVERFDEDVLMALGVLHYHLTLGHEQPPEQTLLAIAERETRRKKRELASGYTNEVLAIATQGRKGR